MNQTEWDSFVLDVFERCYPSTMDWLAQRPDRGGAVLSQWFLELKDFRTEDVSEAIETIHRRNEGPAAYDRECWPAFIRRFIAAKRSADLARSEWKHGSDGAWKAVTDSDATMAQAYRANREARAAARQQMPADAKTYEVDAAEQLAGYTAVGDIMDPDRKNRVPEWGDY